MSSIMLKDISDDLRAQLEQEAYANSRSLDEEALARIEMSFQIQKEFNAKRVQDWIDEALASGPEEALSREKFDAAFQNGVKRFEGRHATQ
jgi:hypothetical protein